MWVLSRIGVRHKLVLNVQFIKASVRSYCLENVMQCK